MTPVFVSYKVEDNGSITLTFQRSYSADVAVHRLWRTNEQTKLTGSVFISREIMPEYTYTDNHLAADSRYSYFLTAEDKNGLQSPVSPKVTLQTPPASSDDVISTLTGVADKRKKQIEVNWRVKTDNITEIVVYRKTNNGNTTLWGTLSGAQNFLEDRDVTEGNTYTYFLKAMTATKAPVKTQNISVEY
jgi:hypothetical protein